MQDQQVERQVIRQSKCFIFLFILCFIFKFIFLLGVCMILSFVIFSKKRILFEKKYGDFKFLQEHAFKVMESNTGNFLFLEKHTIVFKNINDVYLSLVLDDENEFFYLNILNIITNFITTNLFEISEKNYYLNFFKLNEVIDAFILDGIIITVDESNIFSEINYA